jgi:predicted amidophosphoribosyltransferase
MTENVPSNRPRYLNSIQAHRSLCCLVDSVANDGKTADRAVAFLKGLGHIQRVQSISTSARILDEPELSIGACPS